MPDETPPNVKIYDRPERQGPPPLVLVIIALIALAGTFFVYRSFQSAPATAPSSGNAQTSRIFSSPGEHFVFMNTAVRIFPMQG